MSVSLNALLPDLLLSASLGGVPFAIINSRDEVGRRTQRFFFPGRDDTEFQDLGALDGPIRISGLLVGDDYVSQAAAMRAVFRAPGPLTLVHPWIGTLIVNIQGPGTISFSDQEMRYARISFSAVPYYAAAPMQPNTLQALLAGVDGVMTATQSFLASILEVAALPLAVFSIGQAFVSTIAGAWSTAIGLAGADAAILTGAAGDAIATLAAPIGAPAPNWAADTIANLLAVPPLIAGASVPTPPAVVAPGGSAATPPAAAPTSSVAVLLGMVPSLAPYAQAATPAPALAAAMQAALVAQAVSAASDIVYASQQDALAEQAVIVPAIDAAIQAVAKQAQTNTSATWPLWDALTTLRDGFIADLNAQIGRLPAVVSLALPAPTSAWLIAQYLAGDNPAAVFATYQDIVARNKIVHPAMVSGTIEVLAQ